MSKPAPFRSFSIFSAALLLTLAAGCKSDPATPTAPRFAGDKDAGWLQGFNIFVYGRPPLQYLQDIRGSVIAWSVYHSGANAEELKYVRELHAGGVRVASNFATMQGSQSVVGDMDFAERTSCKTLQGGRTKALWILPDSPFLPCNNNPQWIEFLQTRAYDHVNGEADALDIDEMEGIAGHLYFAGFDEHCMEGFRTYLSEHFDAAALRSTFGIDDIQSFDYGKYLKKADAGKVSEDPNPELRRQYVRFQLSSRQHSNREIIRKTRDYGVDRYIAFTGNTFFLNANKQTSFGDLDFLIYENWVEFPPKGKLLNEHRLARAAAPGKPAAMFPNIVNLLDLQSGEDWGVYLHWMMEAFAAGEHFLVPHQAYVFGGGEQSVSGDLTLPAPQLRPYADFMADHWAAHEAEPLAHIGVLYPYGVVIAEYVDKGYETPWQISEAAHKQFLALTRQLDDSHVPYRTLYAGDGELIVRALGAADLTGLDTVVIPTSTPLDTSTTAVLDTFRAGGGTVLAGDAVAVSQIAKSATPVIETAAPDTVAIAPVRDGDTLYLHLVNYDYDLTAHDFTVPEAFELTLHLPEGMTAAGMSATLLTVTSSMPTPLPATPSADGKSLTMSIGGLTDYALVKIGG